MIKKLKQTIDELEQFLSLDNRIVVNEVREWLSLAEEQEGFEDVATRVYQVLTDNMKRESDIYFSFHFVRELLTNFINSEDNEAPTD